MKIRAPSYVMVEAGPFTGFLDLPSDGRIRRGQDMTCDGCGEQIVSERFVGAFRARGKNLKLCLACADIARAGL